MLKLSQAIGEWSATYGTDHIIAGGDFNIAPNSWFDIKPPKRLTHVLTPSGGLLQEEALSK